MGPRGISQPHSLSTALQKLFGETEGEGTEARGCGRDAESQHCARRDGATCCSAEGGSRRSAPRLHAPHTTKQLCACPACVHEAQACRI